MVSFGEEGEVIHCRVTITSERNTHVHTRETVANIMSQIKAWFLVMRHMAL